MEKRTYGATGRTLSIIGFGGVTLVGMGPEEADAILGDARERGINYFDVAPSYGQNQETERLMGPTVRAHRSDLFLACKTGQRGAAGAEEELKRSLANLQTDYFDLYQLHALSSLEDVDQAFGPDGAMRVIKEAQAAGTIRYVGFSAHSAEAALAAMDRFAFHSVLFPINFVTWQEGEFGSQIMAKAEANGVARLALKAMARTHWQEGAVRHAPNCWYEPLNDERIAEMAMRFTLSMPVTAAAPPGDPNLFRMALRIAERFQPITEAERVELSQIAAGLKPIFQAA